MSLSFFRFVYNSFTVTVSMKVIFYDQTGFVVARVLLRVYVSLGCAGRPYCRIQCKVWSSRPAIKSSTTTYTLLNRKNSNGVLRRKRKKR